MFKNIFLCLAHFCLILPSNNALANESDVLMTSIASLGKLVFALIFVLFLFWLFVKLMKQMNVGRVLSNKDLKIIGVLPLGQRERVMVVQAGSEQLVLGVTATQINTLHVLEKPLMSTNNSPVEENKKQ